MSFFAKYPVTNNGVTSLDGLTGALTLVAGTGISIVDGSNTITISSTSSGDVTIGAFGSTPNANGLSINGSQVLNMQPADATHPGGISIADWNTFNNKQAALTFGNLTDAGTDGIVVTGGTGAVIGSGTSLAQHVADTTHNGYLSSTDWNTFNGKQASGNYITALTGDGTASGPGSVALTLATVNSNVGSFGTATQVGTFTVNGKGLITAASNTSIQIAESQVTNLVTDLAAKQSTTLTNTHILIGNASNVATDVAASGDLTLANTGAFTLATVNSNIGTFASVTVNGKGLVTAATALSGDATTSGAALTLATVNSNVGSFGSSTSIPSFTVNGKGLITAASGNAVIAPAGTLSGTTLNSTVVTSSLTSVGTIATGVWNGTTIAIANGGTGQTSKTAAFDALSPMTTGGDIIYGGASGTGTRLANGSAGTFLKSQGTTLAPVWAAPTITLTAPTVQIFTSGTDATYTTPANVLWLKITVVGAGGGGSGSGTAGGTAAGNGGASIWKTSGGTNILSAAGGALGTFANNTGGAGGTVTVSAGCMDFGSRPGTNGEGAAYNNTAAVEIDGGDGGGNAYCGPGSPGGGAGNAAPAANVAGQGGGGGGPDGVTASFSGVGGGGGAYGLAIVTSPSATYHYTVGAGGSAGAAGTSGHGGAAGGAGIIIVEEYYQ